MSEYTILDLYKILTIAREDAICGYYPTSLQKYALALELINNRINELTEDSIKSKWKMTLINLKSEVDHIENLYKICLNIKDTDFNYSKNQELTKEEEAQRIKNQNILVFDMSNNNKRTKPNIEYFGKEPFSHNGNAPLNDPFRPFRDRNINAIGDNVNDHVIPSQYEIINNNVNFPEYGQKKIIKKNNNSKNKGKGFNNNINNYNNNNFEFNQINEISTDNNTILDPLEEFSISKSNIGNVSSTTLISDNNSFINKINNFNNLNKNKKNNYVNKKNTINEINKIKEAGWDNRLYNSNNDFNNYYNERPYDNMSNDTKKIYNQNMIAINNVLAGLGYGNVDDSDFIGDIGINKNRKKSVNKDFGKNNFLNNKNNNNKNYHRAKSVIGQNPINRYQKNNNINNNKNIKNNNKNSNNKMNIKTIKNPNSNKNIKNNNKNSKNDFLLFKYPNGEGPDKNLIELLENEIIERNPNVSFDDIASLESAKKILEETVFLPLLIPEFFKGIRRAWKGVLLYGPPGTGKTLLAKALATQGKTKFFNIHSSSFASKWRGESEKLVRLLFEMAKFYAPSTIFIDEIDSLCSKRGDGDEGEASRRVKAEILVQMDGITNNDNNNNNNNNNNNSLPKIITVIGATNRPWDLDEAIRRRFEKRIYIPLPDDKGREELFKINLKDIKCNKDVNITKLVKMSDGYSGADISNVCREAAFMPMRIHWEKNKDLSQLEDIVNKTGFQENLNSDIKMKDFLQAMKNIKKSVGKDDLKKYDNWTKEFKSV